MQTKIRNTADCPCGSGRQHRHCCLWRRVQWIPNGDGRLSRKIPVRRPLPEKFTLPLLPILHGLYDRPESSWS